MTPGGFKAFEHRWALTQAFEFHDGMGKANVAARTHELAGALKEGLARLPDISLITPQSSELSSGRHFTAAGSFSLEGAWNRSLGGSLCAPACAADAKHPKHGSRNRNRAFRRPFDRRLRPPVHRRKQSGAA
jgi:hypothetical protein